MPVVRGCFSVFLSFASFGLFFFCVVNSGASRSSLGTIFHLAATASQQIVAKIHNNECQITASNYVTCV